MMTLHTIYTLQQYQGLSTDTKPTGNGVVNGSRFAISEESNHLHVLFVALQSMLLCFSTLV